MNQEIKKYTQPNISLIAIAYNLEDYIGECLNSLTNQTHKSIEIIVVDDGSTDSTLSKIQAIAQTDCRLRVLSQKNQGPNSARENGLKIAKGKYVQFIDGDDWLALDACEKLYQKAEEGKADVILFHAQRIYPDKQISPLMGFHKKTRYRHPFKEFAMNTYDHPIYLKFIHRVFLFDNNISFPAKITYGDDTTFSALFYLHSPHINFLDEFIYCYRQRTKGNSHDLQGFINDMNKVINILKSIKASKFNQEIEDYANYLILSYMATFYYRALLAKREDIASLLADRILKEKIFIASHIQHPSPLRWLIYQIYNHFPQFLLTIHKIRAFIRGLYKRDRMEE
jgi:glycosyltransferase involved in cell wall biosynthesis